MPDTFVTFVIPTLMRDSSERTMQSLFRQHDPGWKAIWVADRAAPWNARDLAIRGGIAHFGAIAGRNKFVDGGEEASGSAGALRNVGLSIVDTPWVAFVDDDDWLDPQYVGWLRQAGTGNGSFHARRDVVVQPMEHPVLGVLPQGEELRWGNVGINFAVRRSAFDPEELRFVREDLRNEGPEGNEDIELLSRLAAKPGVRVEVTRNVGYYVGNERTVRG